MTHDQHPVRLTAGTQLLKVFSGLALMALVCAISGCGGVTSNPFASRKPFTATPYPRDFAIVIDTNSDTYFCRTHIHQVIRASSMQSATTYTNYSDYNNTISSRYRHMTPLTRRQIQAMWNAVCKARLLHGAFTWTYWHSRIDRYQRNSMMLQIRAGGREKTYYQLNHWDNNKLPLVLLCESVDLPIGQDVHPELPPPAATTGKAATTASGSGARAAGKPAGALPADAGTEPSGNAAPESNQGTPVLLPPTSEK